MNRPALLLCVSVSVKKRRRFRIILPIAIWPLFVLTGSLMDIYELLMLTPLSKIKMDFNSSVQTVGDLRKTINLLKQLFLALMYEIGSCDLADVHTVSENGKEVKVKLRLI